METLSSQILLVCKLFIYMGIGFFLRRKDVIPASGKSMLSDIVLYVTLPCSILLSFSNELSGERLLQMWQILIVSTVIQIGSYYLSKILYLKAENSHRASMAYGTVVPNSGVLGTPVAAGVFGSDGILLSAVFLIPLRLVMWTLGISIFAKKAGSFTLKKALTHPCILSVFIGMAIMFSGVQLPAIISEPVSAIGSCNTVISMIMIGSVVADMDVGLFRHRDTIYFSVIRLAVLPLMVWLLCDLFGVNLMVRNISVVLTSMPAGSTTPILAMKYGDDAYFASAITAVTTVLSLAALPVWCLILHI